MDSRLSRKPSKARRLRARAKRYRLKLYPGSRLRGIKCYFLSPGGFSGEAEQERSGGALKNLCTRKNSKRVFLFIFISKSPFFCCFWSPKGVQKSGFSRSVFSVEIEVSQRDFWLKSCFFAGFLVEILLYRGIFG